MRVYQLLSILQCADPDDEVKVLVDRGAGCTSQHTCQVVLADGVVRIYSLECEAFHEPGDIQDDPGLAKMDAWWEYVQSNNATPAALPARSCGIIKGRKRRPESRHSAETQENNILGDVQ